MTTVGNVLEEKAEMSLEWSVPNFFTPTVGSRPSFKSPTFPFSGHSWNLQLYPKGAGSENRGWISLFLEMELTPDNGDKTVTFSFGIKRADGSLRRKQAAVSLTFNKNCPSLGWSQVAKRDYLKQRKSELAPSDVLTFACRIVSADSQPMEKLILPTKCKELEILSSEFNDLLNDQKNCDARLKVNGREFQVHKAVLTARSPVFSAMFDNPMSEKEVDIPGCDPEYFGDFLRYLYAGQLEYVSSKSAPHLYIIADKFDVQTLKSFCLKCIKRNLPMENFWDVIALADLHNESELLSCAQAFFSEKATEIFRTAEWVALMSSNSLLANKLLKGMFTYNKIALKIEGKEYTNKRPRHENN